MTVAEIIILIIGAVLFTISFIIPEKKGEGSDGVVNPDEVRHAVRDAVEEEVGKAKGVLEDASMENINDNKDKMERYMDRITNEKMMAISEYYDTVIEQIHKDHQEALFLYDMVEGKYNQVKATAAEITKLEKDVKALSTEAGAVNAIKETAIPAEQASAKVKKTEAVKSKKTTEKKDAAVKKENKKEVSFEPISAKKVVINDEQVENVVPVAVDTPVTETVKIEETPIETNPAGIELMFDSDSNSMNNNDRILALHSEGKSNMAIAKELGLGVGEVKLVIDLFKS